MMRPGSIARRCSRLKNKDPFQQDPAKSPLSLLTSRERQRADDAWKKFPHEVIDVKHDPTFTITKSRHGKMPVLVKGSGLLMIPLQQSLPVPGSLRWFAMVEIWLGMGFPVTEEASAACGAICQFTRNVPAPVGRTRSSQANQCGNGWHLGVFGPVGMLLLMQLSSLGAFAVESDAPAKPKRKHDESDAFAHTMRDISSRRVLARKTSAPTPPR